MGAALAALSQLSLTTVSHLGVIQVGAKVRIYDSGTTTPRTVYQDAALTTPHSQPILTNGSGRIPPIFVSGSDYKAKITTSAGVVIEEIDAIPASLGGGGGGGGGGSSDLETGDVIWSFRTGARTGFVRLNGRTIGSALSGATELASADTEDLFIHLWTYGPALTVSGGRGANAAADFAANKTIALADARGRALIGLDDMGGAAAGRLAGVTWTGAATTLGSTAGASTHALAAGELAAHTHTGTTSTSAAHSHSGTTASDSGHTHTGYTDTLGSHSHGGLTGSTFGLLDNYGAAASIGTGSLGTASVLTSNATLSLDHSHTIAADGSHWHNVTTYSGGAHNHTFATDATGAHSHTVTIDSTGSGTAHANVQPSMVGSFYMRL